MPLAGLHSDKFYTSHIDIYGFGNFVLAVDVVNSKTLIHHWICMRQYFFICLLCFIYVSSPCLRMDTTLKYVVLRFRIFLNIESLFRIISCSYSIMVILTQTSPSQIPVNPDGSSNSF